MRAMIHCTENEPGIHSFYLTANGERYFLFNQNYKYGVQNYFGNGVSLDKAVDSSKAHLNSGILKTIEKLPAYIKYIEKEYEIEVFENKKNPRKRNFVKSTRLCMEY